MADRWRLDACGRSVVVTGAASGIGAALARRFGQAGATVAVLDRDAGGLELVAGELDRLGALGAVAVCDVTDLDACCRAIEAVTADADGVDVLVNNAGITHVSAFAETDVDVLRRIVDVNLFGAVNLTMAALPTLLARQGQIVVLSSVAGFAPLALRCGYAASKHALHGCFESLRTELVGTGVGVTIVCPSFVRTAIGEHAIGGDGGPATATRRVVGSAADPADIADAIFAATMRRRRLLLPSRTAKLAYAMSRLAPARFERTMARHVLGRSARLVRLDHMGGNLGYREEAEQGVSNPEHGSAMVGVDEAPLHEVDPLDGRGSAHRT